MNDKFQITASIVLFNQDLKTLKKTVDSFLASPIKKRLYLIDNSDKNVFEKEFIHEEIIYIFVGENIGFGKAHNLILNKIKTNSEFHLILNPDVAFKADVVFKLIYQLKKQEENVSMITPKVIYPKGTTQFVCRKHPTIFDLFNRRLKFSKNKLFQNEYRNLDLNKSFYPDFIHGCFLLFKTNHFVSLKGFDERYFLYMEDADICRKIDKAGYKKLYYPQVEIIHQYQKGSAKKLKLLFYHLSSAIKYFKKWGF